ncbi:hypothetical protein HAX54_034809 [Datura stramonium]|uniref:Uncharacterized protein n=1 Tax=Datura stramonium TaxID=4076 RepID=A0ABS8VHS1_DATST|nr:hypothetical protein [Datura stramonium]
MLQTTGIDNIDQIKALKDMNSSRKKINANNEESIVSSENIQKENCVEEVADINNSLLQERKHKRLKQEGSTEVNGKISCPNKKRPENNVVNDLDGPHDGEKKTKTLMQVQPESEFDSKRDAVTSAEETLSEESQEFRKKRERSVKESSVKDKIIENNDPFALTPLPKGTGVTAVTLIYSLKMLGMLYNFRGGRERLSLRNLDRRKKLMLEDFIDDQNSKFAEKAKEAKEEVTAAKRREAP